MIEKIEFLDGGDFYDILIDGKSYLNGVESVDDMYWSTTFPAFVKHVLSSIAPGVIVAYENCEWEEDEFGMVQIVRSCK